MGLARVLGPSQGFFDSRDVSCYHVRMNGGQKRSLLTRLGCCATKGLGLVALAGLLGFGVLCWRVDRQGRTDEARPADAIVVLGAAVQPDGQPGPNLRERVRHAVELYRAGYAAHVICTGGERGDPTSAAAVACKLAMQQGVPPEALWLADGSWDTLADARFAAEVMAAQSWRTALLVTHPLHAYRARRFFRQAGVQAYASPTTTDLSAIPQPWRAYYTVREAVGVLWPLLERAGLPAAWTARLQRWVYVGQ